MRSLALALVALAGLSGFAVAQPAAGTDPESAALRYFYADYARKNLIASAEMLPDADYSFRPVDGTRTLAELLGHVADVQYLFCSSLKGEPNPRPAVEAPGRSTADSFEKTAKTKAQVSRALRESFAYCDDAFSRLEDSSLSKSTKLLGHDRTVAMVANLAVVHLVEHYGQVTVYLRLKGHVPPSTRDTGDQGR